MGNTSAASEAQTVPRTTVALEQLRLLRQAQSQRATQYSALSGDFQHYVRTKDEASYRAQLMMSSTSFQASSSIVRAAIQALEVDACRSDLADLLKALQKEEQSKLRFTLILQALRKAEAEMDFSWQRPETPAMIGEEHATDSLAKAGSPHCGCGQANEPTRDEFQNAVREAMQELQSAVERINDILEELRYAEQELTEGLE